jgi:hypothetical protein
MTLASILDEEKRDEIMPVIEEGLGHLRTAMLNVPRLDEEMATAIASLLGGDAMEGSTKKTLASLLEHSDAATQSLKQNLGHVRKAVMEAKNGGVNSVTAELKRSSFKLQSILNDNGQLESSTTGAHHHNHRDLVASLDDEMLGVNKTIFNDMIVEISSVLEGDGVLETLVAYMAFTMAEFSKATELSALPKDTEDFKIFGGSTVDLCTETGPFFGICLLVVLVGIVLWLSIFILLSPILVPIAIYWYLICPVSDDQLPSCSKEFNLL